MKNRITVVLALVFMFIGNSVSANNGVDPTKDALNKWSKKFVSYPEVASVNKEQGLVYVSFELTIKGEAENIEVDSGLSTELNDKAIDIITQMPKSSLFENGFIEGTRFVVPVKFDIIH